MKRWTIVYTPLAWWSIRNAQINNILLTIGPTLWMKDVYTCSKILSASADTYQWRVACQFAIYFIQNSPPPVSLLIMIWPRKCRNTSETINTEKQVLIIRIVKRWWRMTKRIFSVPLCVDFMPNGNTDFHNLMACLNNEHSIFLLWFDDILNGNMVSSQLCRYN